MWKSAVWSTKPRLASGSLTTSSRMPCAASTVRHAIVIGASIAGLCAARVLSDFSERVTVSQRSAAGPLRLHLLTDPTPGARLRHYLRLTGLPAPPGLAGRLRAGLQNLAGALGERAVSAVTHRISDATDRLTQYAEGGPVRLGQGNRP